MVENSEYKKAEIKNIGFVKTILMFLVVLYHSVIFWNGNWNVVYGPLFAAPHLAKLGTWLNSFHIYGFALCSGYLFCYLKYEKNKYSEFGLYVRNKVKRLLIPYIFVCITLFRKFVLAEGPSQLWFLWMLFDIFIIVWPLANVLKTLKPQKLR